MLLVMFPLLSHINWEDATVNNIEDTDGNLISCREDDYWCPKINIDTGIIENCKKGTIADIYYKVCDDGNYKLLDENNNIIIDKDSYVPNCLCPEKTAMEIILLCTFQKKV